MTENDIQEMCAAKDPLVKAVHCLARFFCRKWFLYFLTWLVSFLYFVRLVGPRALGSIMLAPLLPVGLFFHVDPAYLQNEAGVLFGGWMVYVAHGVVFVVSANKLVWSCLLALLAVLLFFNMQGCAQILHGLDSIH
jgi:hypothetical protein